MKTIKLIFISQIILLVGCASSLKSNLTSGATFNELGKTYVVRFQPDRRHLNTIIADKLTLMGYPASSGEESKIPSDVDTLVTYKDNWQWDLTNYMIRINIQFRDGKTKNLIVSGESYRTHGNRMNGQISHNIGESEDVNFSV